MVRDDDQNAAGKSIVVVLNWADELKARTAANNATNLELESWSLDLGALSRH
jgi:hypothetical protein